MNQVVQNYRTGELKLVEVPPPSLRPGGVLVRTVYSLISTGTERMKIETAQKSLLGKARERPDQVQKVLHSIKQQGFLETYQKAMDRLDSMTPLGYSSSGVVLEVGHGADEFAIHDRVACAGAGYANHAEVVFIPRNLCVKVPEGVPLDAAAFTTVGAIALQGVRQAQAVVGENIAVIGLGLVGQLAIQILQAAGCRVIGIDIDPQRVKLAHQLGADVGLVRGESNEETAIRKFTRGAGADAVLITAATNSNDPVELALAICRDRGRIVALGMIRMDLPWRECYEKEIELRLSRSYGPGRYDPAYEERGVDYPIGYVRWTEKRNMEAFLDLLQRGDINVAPLITHRYPFAEAEKAYKVITGAEAPASLGVLLEYGEEPPARTPTIYLPRPKLAARKEETVGISFIGAGHHARSKLLPPLRQLAGVRLCGVATASGLTAKDVAKKYPFAFCTSDPEEIFKDDSCQGIVIATRHHLHAELAIRALQWGKNVLVEKPLALTKEELQRICAAQANSSASLMVGFNRRFSPFVQAMKAFFASRVQPLMMVYRINAGWIPPDHWYQDPVEGGGRILGECGHFIDTLQFLADAVPQGVQAYAIPNPDLPTLDNAAFLLQFTDGSVGTIIYTSAGDASFPKERLEVFCEGAVAVLEDFRSLRLVRGGKETIRRNRWVQDKGHAAQMQAFVAAIQGQREWPVRFEESVGATWATFQMVESLRRRTPLEIDWTEIGLPLKREDSQ